MPALPADLRQPRSLLAPCPAGWSGRGGKGVLVACQVVLCGCRVRTEVTSGEQEGQEKQRWNGTLSKTSPTSRKNKWIAFGWGKVRHGTPGQLLPESCGVLCRKVGAQHNHTHGDNCPSFNYGTLRKMKKNSLNPSDVHSIWND